MTPTTLRSVRQNTHLSVVFNPYPFNISPSSRHVIGYHQHNQYIGEEMSRRSLPAGIHGLKPKEINFVIELCKDFDYRRAAVASGYAVDSGYSVAQREDIAAAIEHILAQRLEASHIDAEWVLMELVDNHYIARQNGNITASNTALNALAKHKFVDAMSAEKIEVSSDTAIMERLQRGRKRMNREADTDEEVSFF